MMYSSFEVLRFTKTRNFTHYVFFSGEYLTMNQYGQYINNKIIQY